MTTKWFATRIAAAAVLMFFLGLTALLHTERLHIENNNLPTIAVPHQSVFRQPKRKYIEPIDWKVHQVRNLTLEQIVEYIEWTNSTSCRLVHDFGGSVILSTGVDGQKAVCLDPAVRPEMASGGWPPVTNRKLSECLVYSFGVNNEWTFDEAMQNFGCRVYAFDPSMDVANHNHTPKIHFYNLGLSHRDHIRFDDDRDPSKKTSNWTMKSLDSIYNNLLGHEGKIIDYLKIDIEGDEWTVLPQLIISGMLNKVRQLSVEIHLVTFHCPDMSSCEPPSVSLDSIRQRVNVIKSLEDYGLVRFDSKFNPWSNHLKIVDGVDWWGYNAYELVWYNPKLARNISN